eukprot:GHVO01022586.1.p1 GENE.GHVO01022586.1~~GHVO01022586.1.p1  ORF type:complete len:106 (+),score=5.54 GHVO01022586.1:411-728(+)
MNSWSLTLLTWQMKFNILKCKVLHLGRNNPKAPYLMNGTPLQLTNLEKDLGIHVDPLLNFHSHVASISSKANSLLYLLRRNFSFSEPSTFSPMFKAIIIYHLFAQ